MTPDLIARHAARPVRAEVCATDPGPVAPSADVLAHVPARPVRVSPDRGGR